MRALLVLRYVACVLVSLSIGRELIAQPRRNQVDLSWVPDGAFGSVHVQFNYSLGAMHGFIDLVDGGAYPSQIASADLDGDGVFDADGVTDDLDGDMQRGTYQASFGTPVALVVPDYDDLVELPTTFARMSSRTLSRGRRLDLVNVYWLGDRGRSDDRPRTFLQGGRVLADEEFAYFVPRYDAVYRNAMWLLPTQDQVLDTATTRATPGDGRQSKQGLTYGVQMEQLDNNVRVDASGGVLGLSHWHTSVRNDFIGPQIGLRSEFDYGRLRFAGRATATLAYHRSRWEQDGSIGTDLVTGSLNHPLYLQPQAFAHRRTGHALLPLGEFRLQAEYELPAAWRCQLGWSAIVTGDLVSTAEAAMNYTLPQMGFTDEHKQPLFQQNLFANLIWER